ncbi:uncharacterized protein [Aristolochia californica]|uniref:uncharacterized protein isoform X2 n=1 Tax=Aristolochia californica TaxID=171875 RepID=UPI0035DC7397
MWREATMLQRWSRSILDASRLGRQMKMEESRQVFGAFRNYAKVAAAAQTFVDYPGKGTSSKAEVNLNVMFWSKPRSLALALDSPLRIEEPKYEGIRYFMLKLLLFYSKQSKSIRGANVIYKRITAQIDKPAIYDVLHMWLCLRRLKEEGKEGVELGQYLYEIYYHDLELRVSKAGVNLLLAKWMKELEKIFYGNIVAYDEAMVPHAKNDQLQTVLWRNVFSDDGNEMPNDGAAKAVQALSRYTRRESTCLSLTGKEAVFYGNFMFTSILPESTKPGS